MALGIFELYGSCPLYGPTLQKVQILQKWGCNPLTYLRNCLFHSPKMAKSAALHTREYKLAYHAYSPSINAHSQIIIITFTTMRMRVPGRSRVIWRAIQHGAQYPEDGTCPLWQCRELNSLPVRQGSACNQQAVPKLCVHHGAATS